LREISLDRTSPVVAVAFSINGKYVGADHADRHADYWAVSDGGTAPAFANRWDNPSYSTETPSGREVRSPDGKYAVHLERFTGATLVDATTRTVLHRLRATGTAYSAVFSDDGTTVAVMFDHAVLLSQLDPFVQLPAVAFPKYEATANVMRFSPDGTRIAFTLEGSVIIERFRAAS
jgi:hypothetical protein